MGRDPIVDEVRKALERRAARFGYDVRSIAADAKTREGQEGRKVVSRPPKRPAPAP